MSKQKNILDTINIKTSLADMFIGGVIMDVVNPEQAEIAQKVILSKYSGFNNICLFSYNSLIQNKIDLNLIRYEYLNNKFIIEE